MVVEAVQFTKNHLNVHFVSNVDDPRIRNNQKFKSRNYAFVIVSKTFTTWKF
jgi:glucose-6-phosphate isomerase